tara:strand:+ start:1043 stop:1234 length:192 start_codon:yes stop_codon:yes gene_type:complete
MNEYKMSHKLEKEIGIEIKKIKAEVRALEFMLEQNDLTAGKVHRYLNVIENLSKRIRRNTPQF